MYLRCNGTVIVTQFPTCIFFVFKIHFFPLIFPSPRDKKIIGVAGSLSDLTKTLPKLIMFIDYVTSNCVCVCCVAIHNAHALCMLCIHITYHTYMHTRSLELNEYYIIHNRLNIPHL